MSYRKFKEDVFEANLALVKEGLVRVTWGNASGFDASAGIVAIKPGGIDYSEMRSEDMVVIDLEGNILDGHLRPSSDTPTHLELYRCFPSLGGIVHTHSVYATAFAQAHRSLPCLGTTHADHFYSEVPVTRMIEKGETDSEYEMNTGKVIVETFKRKDPLSCPGVLVAGHGPFTWGETSKAAVTNSVALEISAQMAFATMILNPDQKPLAEHLKKCHFFRKHGPNAYYGQYS